MRTYLFKFVIFAVCICLPINLLGQQVQTQQEKPLNQQDILKVLVFRSLPRKSDKELNELLITKIRQRKINFLLSAEEEEYMKKVGGSDLLIKTIRENLPKEIEEQIILYKRYTDNYNGDSKQKKTAIEAAKEFIKKYGDDKELKEIIDYLKEAIPDLETMIKDSDDVVRNFSNFQRQYLI